MLDIGPSALGHGRHVEAVALGNERGFVLTKAIEGAVALGKDGKTAVDAIAGVDKNPKAVGANAGQLRDDAIDALGNLASKSDTVAVTVLDDLIKDEKNKNMGQKNRAKQALKKINDR